MDHIENYNNKNKNNNNNNDNNKLPSKVTMQLDLMHLRSYYCGVAPNSYQRVSVATTALPHSATCKCNGCCQLRGCLTEMLRLIVVVLLLLLEVVVEGRGQCALGSCGNYGVIVNQQQLQQQQQRLVTLHKMTNTYIHTDRYRHCAQTTKQWKKKQLASGNQHECMSAYLKFQRSNCRAARCNELTTN